MRQFASLQKLHVYNMQVIYKFECIYMLLEDGKQCVSLIMCCAACSQTTPISTSSMRQSDASPGVDAAATKDTIKMVDTVVLPDVNTGVPTVSSSASIASSTDTTDNECECYMLHHFHLILYNCIHFSSTDLSGF